MAPRSPPRPCGQFIRNPAQSEWIASKRNPKCVIERLFPVRTADRPSHTPSVVRFDTDMNLLLIRERNYDPKPGAGSSVLAANSSTKAKLSAVKAIFTL